MLTTRLLGIDGHCLVADGVFLSGRGPEPEPSSIARHQLGVYTMLRWLYWHRRVGHKSSLDEVRWNLEPVTILVLHHGANGQRLSHHPPLSL